MQLEEIQEYITYAGLSRDDVSNTHDQTSQLNNR